MEVSLGAGGAATCRCCLAPGVAAKDLSSEYDFMGEKEVYADMLLESFDITLSRAVNAGWVICDSCITRLRDSSNFKKQVLHSEKCLLQKSKAGVASTEDVAESKLELTVLKQEEDSDDDHADFETLFYDEEDHNELKKPVVKTEPLASTSNDMSNDEDVPLSSLTAGVKRKARPIKTDTLPKYLRVGPKQLKDPPVRLKVLPAASAKTAPKAPLPRPAVKVGGIKVQLAKESAQKLATSKLSGRQLKITLKNPSTAAVKKGMRSNTSMEHLNLIRRAINARHSRGTHFTVAVLEYSDATPFLTRRKKFIKCIYNCYDELEPDTLRAHTITKHGTIWCKVARGVQKTVLRVDITDLHCTICCLPIDGLNALQNHFKSYHNMIIYTDLADVLVPYKLSHTKFKCQVCDEKCDDFESLDSHMETHFALNICEVCGRGFMEAKNLKAHSEIHAEKTFICEYCKAPFVSETLKRKHENFIHKRIGRLKCWLCKGEEVRFKNHNDKLAHMEQVHNAKKRPTPICTVCNKVFMHEATLKVHMKCYHETVLAHKCDQCTEAFFKKIDRDAHIRLKHTGEKLQCPHCEKSYYSSREWSKHMKLVHSDQERRCPCSKCGKPCVNRYKLKLHMNEEHSIVLFQNENNSI